MLTGLGELLQHEIALLYRDLEMSVAVILKHQTHKFGLDKEKDDRLIITMVGKAKDNTFVGHACGDAYVSRANFALPIFVALVILVVMDIVIRIW